MTDQDPNAAIPPPPPPPPPFLPYVPTESTVVKKKGFGTRAVAVAVGVALIGGGLAFAASQAGDGGADTPEAAVEQLFDAIAAEDVIGVLETLPDGERRAIQQPLEDVSSQLQRLGILKKGFDLSSVGGLDLEFLDLKLSSSALADGITVVHVDDATLVSTVVPSEVPLGDALRDLIEEMSGEPVDIEASSNAEPIDPGGLDLVAIEEGGGWKVSIGYSIAEAARKSAGLPAPAFGHGVQPAGADSPEAAVEAFLRAGVEDLDVEGLIALLPPDEMAALQDYAPLFLDDAKESIADLKDSYHASIEGLDLSSEVHGDRALVRIEDVDISADFDDGDVAVSFDGKCASVDGGPDSEPIKTCVGDVPVGAEGLKDLDLPIRKGQPAIGITAVKVDGKWYVSPVGSLLGAVVGILDILEDDAVERLPDVIDSLTENLGGFAECSFSATGTAIEGLQQPEDDVVTTGDGCGDSVGTGDGSVGPVDPGSPSTTVVGSPSLEAMTAMLRDQQSFDSGPASCIATAIFDAGFTNEQLVVLQAGQTIPKEIYDEVMSFVDECSTPG